MGALWTTMRLLLRHYREGRRGRRVGGRQRVGFDAVALRAVASDPGPEDVAEWRDRVARAANFAAQLSAFERQVVTVMATRVVGAKLAARTLAVPVSSVRAAERSAAGKLDRVAAIAAAGRMCDGVQRGRSPSAPRCRGSARTVAGRLPPPISSSCPSCPSRCSFARERARGQSRSTARQRTPRQDGKAARQSAVHRGCPSVPGPGRLAPRRDTHVKAAATIVPSTARIERHPRTSTRISGTSASDHSELPAIPRHRNPPVCRHFSKWSQPGSNR